VGAIKKKKTTHASSSIVNSGPKDRGLILLRASTGKIQDIGKVGRNGASVQFYRPRGKKNIEDTNLKRVGGTKEKRKLKGGGEWETMFYRSFETDSG